jgi:hypothetical protein
VNTGNVAILNCTDGDTRITFNTRNKDDVKRTKGIIEDMLRRGYTIVVDVGDGRFERVIAFDAGTSEYIIRENVPQATTEATTTADLVKRDKIKRPRGRRMKARDTKAYAVAPTAGGGFGTKPHHGRYDVLPFLPKV